MIPSSLTPISLVVEVDEASGEESIRADAQALANDLQCIVAFTLLGNLLVVRPEVSEDY